MLNPFPEPSFRKYQDSNDSVLTYVQERGKKVLEREKEVKLKNSTFYVQFCLPRNLFSR